MESGKNGGPKARPQGFISTTAGPLQPKRRLGGNCTALPVHGRAAARRQLCPLRERIRAALAALAGARSFFAGASQSARKAGSPAGASLLVSGRGEVHLVASD
jgi:hypothetical protein